MRPGTSGEVLRLTANFVPAHIGNNQITAENPPELIQSVYRSIATARRRGFARLLDRLKAGDVLVLTKLDRLGRNAMDVGSMVDKLAGLGVRVYCLALSNVDLASSTGKLTMSVITR